MLNPIIIAGVCGFIGGLTRAFVGLFKYYFPPTKVKKKLRWDLLLFTLIAAGVIRVFCGLLVSADYKLNLLAGYAGTDFIESIYKVRTSSEVRI